MVSRMSEDERKQQQRRADLDALWRRVQRERKVRVTAGERAFVEAYQGLAEPELYPDEDDILAVMEQFVEHGQPMLRQLMRTSRNPKEVQPRRPTDRATRPHRYQKPFQRRLELIGFVAERVVPFPSLLEGTFDMKGQRIPWRQLSEEWDRTHPCDEKPLNTLKREYFAARSGSYLCGVYLYLLSQEKSAAVEAVGRLVEAARDLRPLLHLSQAEVERTIRPQLRPLLEAIRPRPAEEWRRSLDAFVQRWHDHLSRAQLIVYRLTDCLLGDPAGDLPLRPVPGVSFRPGNSSRRDATGVGDDLRIGWARRRAIDELAAEYAAKASAKPNAC